MKITIENARISNKSLISFMEDVKQLITKWSNSEATFNNITIYRQDDEAVKKTKEVK